MMRMFVRLGLLFGGRALIDFWARRQERKARDAGMDSRIAREQSRRTSRSARQVMRLMRRFMRF